MVTIPVIITTLILVAYQLLNELIRSISLPISGQVTSSSNPIFNNSVNQTINNRLAKQVLPSPPPTHRSYQALTNSADQTINNRLAKQLLQFFPPTHRSCQIRLRRKGLLHMCKHMSDWVSALIC
jgi:hypothetical protein